MGEEGGRDIGEVGGEASVGKERGGAAVDAAGCVCGRVIVGK